MNAIRSASYASYEWQPLPEERPLPYSSSQPRTAPRHTLIIGALWFLSSALFSTYANTAFLKEPGLGDPLVHAVVRFGTSALVGFLTMAVQGDWHSLRLAPRRMLALWLPGLCLLAANLLNSLALQLSGITITCA